MANSNLLTDEEYLDSLYESPTGYEAPTDDPAFLREAVEAAVQDGLVPLGTKPNAFVKEMFNPRESFRGAYGRSLVEECRRALPIDLEPVLDTPVGFLHLDELNGFASPTPRGNAVIVINRGVLLHAHLLGRCTLALSTYGSPDPFCRDHEAALFGHAIICLGRFVATGSYDHLKKIKVWNCPSLDPLDRQSAKFSVLVQLFVLLHEYGHVACGHLDPTRLAARRSVKVYAQNHAQEHEADAFAFTHTRSRFGEDAAAVAAATLFGFFNLIEHIVHGAPTPSVTHPSGMDRWTYLKQKFALQDPGRLRFGLIDSMFDMLIENREGVR
jgi:hypothetical protein